MRKSVIAIIVIVLVVLYMSVFVVKEGERGITLRFGKVLRDDENKPLVYAPGLHFKIPFIESVKMLDARIQTMDNQADRFVTKEKKDLIVDSYIKWRISDFSRYYLATGGGDVSQAEVLLKRKFSDRLRSEIGRLDVKDIVTDSRGRLTLEVRDALNSGSAGTEDEVSTPAADDAIAKAAERVEAETNGKVQVINPNSMAALGIEVVDVRIKQINLPAEVSEAIYNRMRAEVLAMRRKMRDAHGSKGELFDLKHDAGGLIDVEFLIQYLVLGHSHDHPQLTGNLGNIALLRIASELGLIPAGLAAACADSYRELRRLQHRQRLNERPSRIDPDEAEGAREPVRALWRHVFGE